MSEWRENSNGNYVYVIDTDDVMTVYERNGMWFGVYDSQFTEDGFKTPEQAMDFMEKAVLGDGGGLKAQPGRRLVGEGRLFHL